MYRLHISIYGIDHEENKLITRRTVFDRVIENVRRVISIPEHAAKVHLGFRLLRNRSQQFLEEWILRTFGQPLPFGWTVDYMNWMDCLDTTQSLPLDGRWIQLGGRREQCFLPLLACHIFSNGDASFCPCDDFNGVEDLRLGNILEKPLSELYNSEKARQLWKMLPQACSGCTAYLPLTNIEAYQGAFDDPIAFRGG